MTIASIIAAAVVALLLLGAAFLAKIETLHRRLRIADRDAESFRSETAMVLNGERKLQMMHLDELAKLRLAVERVRRQRDQSRSEAQSLRERLALAEQRLDEARAALIGPQGCELGPRREETDHG